MCCNLCCDWAQLLRVWGIAHLCGESSQQSVQLESLIRHSATHRDHDCIQSKVEESRPPHLIRSGPITGLATVLTKLGGVRPSHRFLLQLSLHSVDLGDQHAFREQSDRALLFHLVNFFDFVF
ncbi:hypothetical protein VTN49DRAFT_1672 [Thermomyces lanuginosus]|uniref:uncharacterized protein n=1 Tax=Thermomyces lanuginosus TaxID=5541 RepID=UPI0037445AFD